MAFCLLACAANAQKANKWIYPVNTEEWSKIQKRKDRIEACQIPKRVISSLTTEELTELCLQYPYIENVLSFNNLNSGLNKLFRDFNGIGVLFEREDVTKELLKQYQTNLQKLATTKGRNKQEAFINSISVLEALLTRCDMENSNAKEKYREILQNLVTGYETKNIYTDDLFNKNLGLRTNYFSRIVMITKVSEQSIEEFSQEEKNVALISGMADEKNIRLIDEMSYKLIK